MRTSLFIKYILLRSALDVVHAGCRYHVDLAGNVGMPRHLFKDKVPLISFVLCEAGRGKFQIAIILFWKCEELQFAVIFLNLELLETTNFLF